MVYAKGLHERISLFTLKVPGIKIMRRPQEPLNLKIPSDSKPLSILAEPPLVVSAKALAYVYQQSEMLLGSFLKVISEHSYPLIGAQFEVFF
jgi:hypothetical protein